jgi:hypothetical protein
MPLLSGPLNWFASARRGVDEGQPAHRRTDGRSRQPDTGLRTERRITHAFLMDVPTYHKPLIVTDAAINIAPDLDTKRDICQNAIDLAHVLGIARPKVAIICAVESINSRMVCTTDAASLCKMADRGQITGAILDGPLALDNAISKEAARIKKIDSAVAGDPDILVVPDLVSRQHPRQAAHLHEQCRRRRHRPRRARADHPHQPRRQPAYQARLVRGGLPDGQRGGGADADEDGSLRWKR